MQVRKIIQIIKVDTGVVALCDDGTVWGLMDGPIDEICWKPAPPIPQSQFTNPLQQQGYTRPPGSTA